MKDSNNKENITENNDFSISEERISGKMTAILLLVLVSFIMVTICIVTIHKNAEKQKNNNEKSIVEDTMLPIQNEESKVTEISEYVLSTAKIDQQEYEQIIEAEDVNRPENIVTVSDRPGFSGAGYITGFTAGGNDKIDFVFDIPTDQHYDISICFASDLTSRNEFLVDNKSLFDFSCTENMTGQFVIKNYYGVFFKKGKQTLTFHSIDGAIDIDYVKIANNKSIYSAGTDVPSDLIGPASPNTQKLMKYLTENFGKNIITGQYVSDINNIEIEKIHEFTSNYPAVRFGDMGVYSINPDSKFNKESDDDIQAAIKWADKGGIVGYVWHWKAPMNVPDVYSDKTDFKLSLAYTDIDVALLTPEEIQAEYEEGNITAECLYILKDIDYVSAQLKRLQEKDIPVLWRPLHEAGGDWFWWGNAGPDVYRWLWTTMYRRMTGYYKLDNLIWVWSAQGKEFYVGNSLCDIAAVDIYDENKDNSKYYKQYQWLYSLTGGQKLIALSECGKLPDIELTFRDRAVWSYFGLWYGEYLLDKNGNLSEKYNIKDELQKMYNSNRTITLEKYIKSNGTKSPAKDETAVTTAVTDKAPDAAETEIIQ